MPDVLKDMLRKKHKRADDFGDLSEMRIIQFKVVLSIHNPADFVQGIAVLHRDMGPRPAQPMQVRIAQGSHDGGSATEIVQGEEISSNGDKFGEELSSAGGGVAFDD